MADEIVNRGILGIVATREQYDALVTAGATGLVEEASEALRRSCKCGPMHDCDCGYRAFNAGVAAMGRELSTALRFATARAKAGEAVVANLATVLRGSNMHQYAGSDEWQCNWCQGQMFEHQDEDDRDQHDDDCVIGCALAAAVRVLAVEGE